MTLDSSRRDEAALDGRYALGDLLGTGGVADVYRARDLRLDRDVAVKVFGQGIDPSGPARERAEMRTLAGLSHPNLVTLHDAGTDAAHGTPRAYLVMALIDGPSLAERLREGPMLSDDVRRLGLDVAAGLSYVHSRGVVHRDVKPGNILLEQSGKAYLADFGVAQVLGASALTVEGGTVGTAAFMSPEQVRGLEVTPASDVYAFGLVLLEALTGDREYPGTSVETALARLSRSPVITGRVPSQWRDLLLGMTASEPGSRPSAQEVAGVLAQELGSSGATGADDRTQLLTPTQKGGSGTQLLTGLRPAAVARPSASHRPRSRALIAAAAAVLVVVALLLVVGQSSGGAGPLVPTPPAGSPGPARLDSDLNRLQELVK